MTTTIAINPELDASESSVPHLDVNGSSVTYRSYPANSYSDTTNHFSILPPGMNVYMSRSIRNIQPIKIVMAGSTGGANMLDDGYDALRNYADYKIQQNNTINFNGTGLTTANIYDMIPDILAHFNRAYKGVHPLAAPDVTQILADGVGSTNNPLSSYAASESYPDGGVKRGAFVFDTIARSTTAVTITCRLISWIYVPQLFGADCANEMGLIRIRNIDIDQTLNLDSKYVWSHATGGGSSTTISSITVTANGIPTLLCKWITPPTELVPKETLRYRHLRFERQVMSLGATLAPNASATIVSNNIQLHNIPRYVFNWVRESDSYKTFASADSYCAMTNIQYNLNNSMSLLATATPQDLWSIAKECGLLDFYVQFSGLTQSSGFATIGTSGSMMCAEFGRHISLGDQNIAIGTSGQFNFFTQVTFTNVNQSVTLTNPTLYTILAYDQDLVVSPTGDVSLESPITPVGKIASGIDVIEIPYNTSGFGETPIPPQTVKHPKWAKFWKFIKEKILPIAIPAIASIGKTALTAIGDEGEGGAVLTQEQLRNMVRKM